MALSIRKEKILSAVINSYISSCEPISSQEIRDKHLPSVSSATIRNELASLEEMGYLTQPHTSAGRIPTADAYRLYVQKLMPKHSLSTDELKIVNRYFDNKIFEIEHLLKSTAQIISQITNLTSVAYAQKKSDLMVKTIKFVKLENTKCLVIVMTDGGMLDNATMDISSDINDFELLNASQFVSSIFQGHTIAEIADTQKFVAEVKENFKNFFDSVLEVLKKYALQSETSDLVFEGSSKILEQPEFSNIEKAKAMLSILESKKELIPVLKNNGQMSVSIKIGQDIQLKDNMPECAIVTATYTIGGKNIGNAGVIGPMRMDYPKIISLLDYIGKTLNR
ncbi:MAG: heat-inducible transcriptional repressor HrcA [Clostridiales bacterium]|nr:heat-inducible transcriptional repressor HrcA [Clostridiales bacterium]